MSPAMKLTLSCSLKVIRGMELSQNCPKLLPSGVIHFSYVVMVDNMQCEPSVLQSSFLNAKQAQVHCLASRGKELAAHMQPKKSTSKLFWRYVSTHIAIYITTMLNTVHINTGMCDVLRVISQLVVAKNIGSKGNVFDLH
jgi:hypothetical protein